MLKNITIIFFYLLIPYLLTAQVNPKKNGIKHKLILTDPDYMPPVYNQTIKLHKSAALAGTSIGLNTNYDYVANSIVRDQIIWWHGAKLAYMIRPYPANEGNTVRHVIFTQIDSTSGTPSYIDIDEYRGQAGWPDLDVSRTGLIRGTIGLAVHAPSKLAIFDGWSSFINIPFDANSYPSFQFAGDNMWLGDGGAPYPFFSTNDAVTFTKWNSITAFNNIYWTANGGAEMGISKSPDEKTIVYYGTNIGDGSAYNGIALNKCDNVWTVVSNNSGVSWTAQEIGQSGVFGSITNYPNYAPLFTNFGQVDVAVTNAGVIHAVANGYGLNINGNDTSYVFPVVYYNSSTDTWKAISNPTIDTIQDISLYFPGNSIGNCYPSVSVSEEGQVVYVCWTGPQVTSGKLDTVTDYRDKFYWTDLYHAWSTDGGNTWTKPAVLSGDKATSEEYGNTSQLLRFDPVQGKYVADIVYLADLLPGVSIFAGVASNNPVMYSHFALPNSVSSLAPINITLKDNGNIQQTLTFGTSPNATDGIDTALGETSLPPVPPANTFDARFQLPITPIDFSIKDFRKDTIETATWTMLFQPGSGGYPFTFTWNKDALPAGSFKIKDLETGTIVNVNMKDTGSFTLTNTSITSLKIEYSKQICCTVPLVSGWNIMSVPAVAPDMNSQTLFPGYTSPTYGFNNGYVIATTLTNGEGYWIKYASTSDVNICGMSAEQNTIPLIKGWNLIGLYENNITAANIATNPVGIITSPFYGYNNGYFVTTTLQSGQGYWVRTSQGGEIEIPTTLKKSRNSTIAAGEIKAEWGRISVTDIEGRTGILYTAKGSIELSSYDLPPVPPSGIFDIRYSSNRNVETFDKPGNELIINSASYPITIKAIGTTIKLKDKATGNLVNSSLKDGESIQLKKDLGPLSIESDNIPTTYSMYQNYPNPFNPSTTIRYDIPEDTKVNISIYNALGELVETLVNEPMEAGYHQAVWNAGNRASGIYIYRLTTEKYSSVKKLMLMK